MNSIHNPQHEKRIHQRWNGLIGTGLHNIAPNNASALWAFVFLLVLSLSVSSCSIYEYPDDDCFAEGPKQPLDLTLQYITSLNEMEYEIGDESAVETGKLLPMELTGEMTYTIHAYRIVDGNVRRDNYEEFVVTKDVEGNYDLDTRLELAPGDYRIMVWSDFLVDGKSYYYNSDNFASVTVDTDPYTGDTDYRDAFEGYVDINVAEMPAEAEVQSTRIEMRRPLARYQFVTTDLKKFLEEEARINGVSPDDINLSDYYVAFTYPQFMPNMYNMFTERPADSATGVAYRAELTSYGTDEATLGFDYVFVNHNPTAVMAQATVYAKKSDRMVARTSMIKVPLLRGCNTVVRGSFLLRKDTGGVGIDPGFSGDYNLSGKLESN